MRKTVLIIALLLCGCAQTWQPKCRHDAMYAALVVGEFYPVRIVSGTTKTGRHAQAQAYIAPEWVWLDVDKQGLIVAGRQDRFEPDRTYTVWEYYLNTFAEDSIKWQQLLQTRP